MGKFLLYIIAVYVFFRAGRYLLSIGSKRNSKPQQKEPYFKSTDIRDAEFTDIEDKDE